MAPCLRACWQVFERQEGLREEMGRLILMAPNGVKALSSIDEQAAAKVRSEGRRARGLEFREGERGMRGKGRGEAEKYAWTN